MTGIWTVAYWKDTAERAVKTFAQSLVAAVAVGTPLLDIEWTTALGLAGAATLLSVLSSIGSAAFGRADSASLVRGG